MSPSYLQLYTTGELARRIDEAVARLESCRLCPRRCGVNRLEGETGACGTGRYSRVASFSPHFGEEGPLVGHGGSGTVFFSGCNLGCVFCQNHDISHHPDEGLEASPEELAGVMLELARQGAHNINFVTPSHVVPQLLEALPVAVEHGLRLPLVYNSSGYDSVSTLRLLEDVVDIYMPDVKLWDPDEAHRLLGARDYPQSARAAVAEMHRQVGDLQLDEDGLAVRGLLVRHLIMPGDVAGTVHWMKFLGGLSTRTCLNLMNQYRPCASAHEHPDIDRAPTPAEFETAARAAADCGLDRLDASPGVFRLLK